MKLKTFLTAFLLLATFHIYADDYSAVEYYNLGREAEMSGDFFRAVEMYKSALILNEKYYDAVSGLAHAYYMLDEFYESLKYVIEAEKLDSENTDLMNLKGRIYLNLGDLQQSKDIFTAVLSLEENNIDAEFGLAELDIASGRVLTAENRYRDVLLVSPESRKALLALVMINDSTGNLDAAEIYLKQALQFYTDNPFVRLTAAEHYFKTRNFDESLYNLKTALFLQPDFLEASILLCEIYMKEKKYDEIINEIEKVLDNHEDENILWYMLGRAYENRNNPEKAIMSYARAILIRPDDDLSRIALENEIISVMPMDSPLRERYAAYHLDLGRKYETRNMLDKALMEYRRALVINPYSIESRLMYADIFKRKGFIERYLLILTAIVDEGYGTTDILDEIEIQKSMLDQTISESWGINQFSIEKEQNNVSIFCSDHGMSHSEGEIIISEYLEYLINAYDNITVDSNGLTDNFADSYRISRENDSDYFVIFKCAENERAVSLTADIYLASTGNKLKSIQLVRTGNQMLPEAGRSAVRELQSLLPVYGEIINRRFDEIIVNLGAVDGLKKGDELSIIRKGELEISKDGFSMEYDNSSVIGTYTVEKTDELVSEGYISIKGFFDMINPGDSVFIPPVTDGNEVAVGAEDEQMFYTGDLFNSITNIR